jgi:hypothetical protein
LKGCNDLTTVLAESSAIVFDRASHSIDVGDGIVVFLLVMVEKKDVWSSLDEMRLVDLIEEGMIELIDQNVDVES